MRRLAPPNSTNAGVTNVSYFFNAFEEMTEVVGFQHMSGITSAGQMFGSCPKLETIYATSFSNTGLSGSLMFNGCNRLVGGAFERHQRVAVLLQLSEPRRRQRHGLVELECGIHVLSH